MGKNSIDDVPDINRHTKYRLHETSPHRSAFAKDPRAFPQKVEVVKLVHGVHFRQSFEQKRVGF